MADVAIISVRGIPNRYGGFERLVEVLAPHLVSTGRRVTVFCEADAPDIRNDQWRGVERHFIRRRLPGPMGTIAYDVESMIKVKPGSVALVFGYGTAILHGALLSGRGIPHCVNMDGIEWMRAKWSPAARKWLKINELKAAKYGDVLISDHPEIANSLQQRFGVPSEMVAYGVDIKTDAGTSDARHPILDAFAGRPFHLIIARPEPENQIRLLLEGWRASGGGTPVIIVGNFESTDYGRQLMSDFSEAHFAGPIYDAAVLDALRARASCYLHGHSVGGTNPSLIEAMAAGALVVAHDNVFNRWVLGDGGLFFEDAEQLGALMRGLPAAAEREGMIANAHARCREDFMWPQILERYTDIVERLEARLPA